MNAALNFFILMMAMISFVRGEEKRSYFRGMAAVIDEEESTDDNAFERNREMKQKRKRRMKKKDDADGERTIGGQKKMRTKKRREAAKNKKKLRTSNNDRSSINPVLVSQCDPTNPNSYLSTKNPQDTISQEYCEQYVEYCDKKMTTLSTPWRDAGNKYVYIQPGFFYDTLESMYEQCAKTCSDQVGGIEKFCGMPDAPKQTQPDTSYCGLITNDISSSMIEHEDEVLKVVNERRYTKDGIVCNTKNKPKTFPQASPLVMNDALRCAARIQAKNIVDKTIEKNGSTPKNLHYACPTNAPNGCDDFWDRVIGSGYKLPTYPPDLEKLESEEYDNIGFGWVGENTAVNFKTSTKVVDAWLKSREGHCDTVMQQQSIVVTGEVGIGYYERDGYTGHVMITAQRTL